MNSQDWVWVYNPQVVSVTATENLLTATKHKTNQGWPWLWPDQLESNYYLSILNNFLGLRVRAVTTDITGIWTWKTWLVLRLIFNAGRFLHCRDLGECLAVIWIKDGTMIYNTNLNRGRKQWIFSLWSQECSEWNCGNDFNIHENITRTQPGRWQDSGLDWIQKLMQLLNQMTRLRRSVAPPPHQSSPSIIIWDIFPGELSSGLSGLMVNNDNKVKSTR